MLNVRQKFKIYFFYIIKKKTCIFKFWTKTEKKKKTKIFLPNRTYNNAL